MKAVICGSGIAGLTAAHELAELDWEVTVLEQAPAPRTQGYMVDFFGPGYDAAERMYVLPQLAEAGYQVDELRYHDDTGRTRARLSYRRIADALGGRVFSIMRPDLETALREALPAGVRQLFGTSVRSVDDHGDGVEITTTRGLVLHADLLVGADGAHSRIRRLVFGPERDYLRYLGLHTAAFTFRDTAVRDEIGDAVCLTESIDRQIGLYGLHDGRVAVFAVHRETDPTLPDAPADAVRAAYAPLGWVAPRVLAHVPPRCRAVLRPGRPDRHAVVATRPRGAGRRRRLRRVLARGAGCLPRHRGRVRTGRLPTRGHVGRAGPRRVRADLPSRGRGETTGGGEGDAVVLAPHQNQLRIRRAALTLARIPVFTRYVAGAVTGKAATLLQASQREAA